MMRPTLQLTKLAKLSVAFKRLHDAYICKLTAGYVFLGNLE